MHVICTMYCCFFIIFQEVPLSEKSMRPSKGIDSNFAKITRLTHVNHKRYDWQ